MTDAAASAAPADSATGAPERLERMADRMRKMALSRTVQPRPVSLRSVTEHVRLLLADKLVSQSLKVEIKEGLEVLADPDALIQVLLNLLANAIDACPSGRSVGLSTVIEPEGVLRVVVWDEGPGFSVPVARMFEPWFTTKPQGTGLGLAITHRLVRAHGWEIVAERRGGRTCFDVVIPLGEWRQCSTAGTCTPNRSGARCWKPPCACSSRPACARASCAR